MIHLNIKILAKKEEIKKIIVKISCILFSNQNTKSINSKFISIFTINTINNSMTEVEVREELALVLKETPNDYGRILSLSTLLSSFDKENIRFSVDAGVIDRLGSELVAKQETAVSELVKNSYDADATNVRIYFKDSDDYGGTLFIIDNGTGMTRDQLINGFMRISSSSKIHNPFSERYNRKRAGQKGIGRFAVQRLGERLTIITQTLDNESAIVLNIDWNKYTTDLDLLSIDNTIDYRQKEQPEGTILKIEGLKDKWSEASIKRIYNYVNDILQPFPLSEMSDEKQQNLELDSGFKVEFAKVLNKKIIKIADDKLMVYDHATAIFNGFVDLNGKAVYSIESQKLNINEIHELSSDPDNENIPFKHLKKIKFRAYYFIYNANLIPKMQESNIRKIARRHSGIRLYRNGFRVLPYGEPNNDWLGLDASVVRRSILPTHANVNFFGFVELEDSDNNFIETSSREGLLENEGLIELKNFVYRAILSSVIKVAEYRNVKIHSGQKMVGKIYESVEIRIKNIAFTLEELDRELERETGNIEVKRRRRKKINDVKRQIKELEKEHNEEKEQFLKERSMLRILSSVGLTIGLFLHEVKDYILNMEVNVSSLIQTLEKDLLALEKLEKLQNNIEVFNTYTSYFDAVISQNVIRNLVPIDIKKTLESFYSTIKNDLDKSNIKMNVPLIEGYYLFTCPMHPSEWSSILFNLYTNSKKAIKRTINEGQIDIHSFKNEDKIILYFSDTGDGIKEDIKERIFEEFFTTSSPSTIEESDELNENIGTGLGLKIVKDILTSYRGKIFVDSPREGYSTTIKIEIPLATDKELDKYEL
ncbi:sensor histidine kinase [Myroides odoratimimus]|uniref:sensor histidine kinase n=1 Tax=Myroides odoratimimus TaxID=76832 RepID=UPI002DBBA118|nr:sensor histidine kinase [Myroides odoratimimus]MEC4036565.1 sensor histidine kinase [Myroides odoratimimus]